MGGARQAAGLTFVPSQAEIADIMRRAAMKRFVGDRRLRRQERPHRLQPSLETAPIVLEQPALEALAWIERKPDR